MPAPPRSRSGYPRSGGGCRHGEGNKASSHLIYYGACRVKALRGDVSCSFSPGFFMYKSSAMRAARASNQGGVTISGTQTLLRVAALAATAAAAAFWACRPSATWLVGTGYRRRYSACPRYLASQLGGRGLAEVIAPRKAVVSFSTMIRLSRNHCRGSTDAQRRGVGPAWTRTLATEVSTWPNGLQAGHSLDMDGTCVGAQPGMYRSRCDPCRNPPNESFPSHRPAYPTSKYLPEVGRRLAVRLENDATQVVSRSGNFRGRTWRLVRPNMHGMPRPPKHSVGGGRDPGSFKLGFPQLCCPPIILAAAPRVWVHDLQGQEALGRRTKLGSRKSCCCQAVICPILTGRFTEGLAESQEERNMARRNAVLARSAFALG
jgi:hypothetical protein